MDEWTDWSALHERVPEDEKASFQQELMQLAQPAPSGDVPYAQAMSEDMQGVLEALERNGRVLIRRDLIPESFRKYA